MANTTHQSRTNQSAHQLTNLSNTPAPIALVLLITFLGSMGTAVVTTGIAFIADQGLGYSGKQNLILALALGAVYIPAAYFSGPVLTKLINRYQVITTKRVLIAIMLILTTVAQGPLIANVMFPDSLRVTEVFIWVMGLVFMMSTGVQWPIIHAYLSGGRTGRDLRKGIGKFNITWATALVLAFWSMAPLLENHPFLIVSLLGGIHLIIAGLVVKLPSEPAKHLAEHDDPNMQSERHPPVYIPLLRVFRMMLIASYVILSVMTPLMPSIETRIGLEELWWTPVASTWLVVRIIFFALLERWHGWHGRWWTPWIGMGSLIIGFGIAMAAPLFGPYGGSSIPTELADGTLIYEFNALGLSVFIAGLSLAGVGIALTYYGALYYAMAVGGSDVDSGGKHEAFIGLGYTLGPLCGIIGGTLGNWEPGSSGPMVILVTSIVVTGMVGATLYKTLFKMAFKPAPSAN